MRDQIILSDSSCLISLINLNQLDLLQQLYKEVLITTKIVEEVGTDLPDWIRTTDTYSLAEYEGLRSQLDPGEASAIALALSLGLDRVKLIIDEQRGRRIARGMNIQITGTLGVITSAQQRGIITNGKELVLSLFNSNFRMSEALKNEVLNTLDKMNPE